MPLSPRAAPAIAVRHPERVVLIAGGGIGGLATALALAKSLIPSHVLERRAEFAEEGAGIQIGPNGVRILAELGVASALRPHVVAPEMLRLFDLRSGAEIAQLPLGVWMVGRHGTPYWTAHRQDLHDALLAAARAEPLVRITTGAAVVSALSGESTVEVRTQNGRSFEGGALVAADGLGSVIRSSSFKAPPLRFARRSALRTVIATPYATPRHVHTDVCLWLGRKAHVVHYPVRGGKELALVVVLAGGDGRDEPGAPVEPGFVAAHAARFPDALRQLLAEAATWRRWPLVEAPRQAKMASGRIALLGDAAHPVLPFLAQGAVLALEDAAVLGRCLGAAGIDIERGLEAYAKSRRKRVQRMRHASRRNGRIYHLGGVMAALRNATLSGLPPTLLMSRFDWIYGWKG